MILDCIIDNDAESLKLLTDNGLNFDKSIEYVFDMLIRERYIADNYDTRKRNQNNIIEFLLDNYPDIRLNNIFVHQEDINKYKFIKMLVNKNMLDLPD